MDEQTTITAHLLLAGAESTKEVSLTVVREGDGNVSLTCEGFCLLVDAEALREALGG